jgi:hypothetical protein
MNEAVKKRMKTKHIKEALSDPVRNAEPEYTDEKGNKKRKRINRIKPEEIKTHVPFSVASKLNRQINLREQQTNIRKLLTVFIQENFEDFINDYNRLNADPELRIRLYFEVLKMLVPKPLPVSDGDADTADTVDMIYRRLFAADSSNGGDNT